MASTNRVSREKPQALADAIEASNRGNRYGENYVQMFHGKKHNLADEGSYFVATNPTLNTAIALTTSITTWADSGATSSSALFMKNSELRTNASAKRVYFDYIKMTCVGAPTSATEWQYAIHTDDAAARYTSGGTALVPINPNADSSVVSIVTGYFGAVVTAAATNRRLVSRGMIRPSIPVVRDEFIIVSGPIELGGSYGAAAGVLSRIVVPTPPIIIGPQQQMVLSLWGVACAAASTWEFELCWWER
jgi:hypothetical protein